MISVSGQMIPSKGNQNRDEAKGPVALHLNASFLFGIVMFVCQACCLATVRLFSFW